MTNNPMPERRTPNPDLPSPQEVSRYTDALRREKSDTLETNDARLAALASERAELESQLAAVEKRLNITKSDMENIRWQNESLASVEKQMLDIETIVAVREFGRAILSGVDTELVHAREALRTIVAARLKERVGNVLNPGGARGSWARVVEVTPELEARLNERFEELLENWAHREFTFIHHNIPDGLEDYFGDEGSNNSKAPLIDHLLWADSCLDARLHNGQEGERNKVCLCDDDSETIEHTLKLKHWKIPLETPGLAPKSRFG